MLRIGLIIIGSVMLVCVAFGTSAGWPFKAVIPLALWGAILAGGVLVERWRYQLPGGADGRQRDNLVARRLKLTANLSTTYR